MLAKEPKEDDFYTDGIDKGCWDWSEAERSVFCTTEFCDRVQKTTLYCSCCSADPPLLLRPLLITGTPRSGTVFLSSLLSSLGLKMGADTGLPTRHGGIVSWVHLFADYHPDLHFTSSTQPAQYSRVLQLVRDPLASLTSIAFTEPILHDAGYLRYIARHIPLQDSTTLLPQLPSNNNNTTTTPHMEPPERHALRLRRALEFYTGWHRTIASLHVPLLRLEELDADILEGLFLLVGRRPPARSEMERLLSKTSQRNGTTTSGEGRPGASSGVPHEHLPMTLVSASVVVNSSMSIVDDASMVAPTTAWTEPRGRRRLAETPPWHWQRRRSTRRRRRSDARPPQSRYRRRKPIRKGVHSNERAHRKTLEWRELCQVDATLTANFLDLAQSFGYYDEIENVDDYCSAFL